MFDTVTLAASDVGASERFYRTTLAALGLEPSRTAPGVLEWDELRLRSPSAEHDVTRALHVSFVAATRADVDAFWRAGVDAGYPSDGAPGERPQYKPDYYGAFLLDPDGNSAEAVHHDDSRLSGIIDHLWLRVSDVGAAEHQYALLSRHTGLREGRRWSDGIQFRGSWGTLSLVSDGAPVSAGVQLAFPALNRATVDAFHAAGLGAGLSSVNAPGAAEDLRGRFYGAALRGPDGSVLRSLVREPRV